MRKCRLSLAAEGSQKSSFVLDALVTLLLKRERNHSWRYFVVAVASVFAYRCQFALLSVTPPCNSNVRLQHNSILCVSSFRRYQTSTMIPPDPGAEGMRSSGVPSDETLSVGKRWPTPMIYVRQSFFQCSLISFYSKEYVHRCSACTRFPDPELRDHALRAYVSSSNRAVLR